MKRKQLISKSTIIGISLILSACQTTTTAEKAAYRGEHKEIAQSIGSDSGNFDQIPLRDLVVLCTALVKVRDYKKSFDCINVTESRIAKGEAYRSGLGGNYNHYALAQVFTAKTEALLSLGQKEMAWRVAQKAVASINESIAGGWGVSSSASIGPYGAAALAAASVGKMNDARQLLDDVEKINTGWGGRYDLHHQKIAVLAQGFMAINDYRQALKWIETEGYVDSSLLRGTMLAFRVIGIGLLAEAMVERVTGGSIYDFQRFERDLIHAHVLFKVRDFKRSKEKLDTILSSEKLRHFSEFQYIARLDRARIDLDEGNDEAAVVHLRKAIDVIEEQRSSISTENYKFGFAGEKQTVYADMIGALLRLGRIDEAFEYVERAKARALVDLLASKMNFGDNHDGETTRELLSELARLEQESRKFTPSANGSITRSGIDALRDIKASSAELGSLVSVSTASSAEIQSQLKPDEALIEYFYRDNKAYAFVVRNGSVKSFTIVADDLHDDVADFRDAIDDYQSDDWKKLAKALYGRLLAPVMGSLIGVRHLTIVPHGVLHYLPFNALGDRSLLIERFTVRLLPSASTLRYLNKKRSPTANLLVFGNPDLNNPTLDLPGAEQEANDIATLWKGSRVLLRKSASESVAKKIAGAFRFLHFASHGEFNPDEPMKSRMLLSPDGENDGSLTVSEIYDLKLNADMVTLSACQTGLGDVKNGDDVVGLNRGFLYAGAKSVVASLWRVPDKSTRDLMTTFYKNLKIMDQRSALQKAQLSTKAKYKHPIFWASFQMTGGT